MSALTRDILKEVEEERGNQVLRGFGRTNDAENLRNDWVAYICAHAGRAVNCYHNDLADHGFREQMIRVAALAVAAVEMDDLGEIKR